MPDDNKDSKTFYQVLKMDKEKDILIVDPYIVNLNDLYENNIENIVRIRRPGWGKGDISGFIKVIDRKEFRALLEKLIATQPSE